METEGVTFPEAVERLAAEAGVPLPEVAAEDEEREKQRRSLTTWSNLPRSSSRRRWPSRHGAEARGYLADRGLDPATQRKFRIGYAPAERFALKEHLAGRASSART